MTGTSIFRRWWSLAVLAAVMPSVVGCSSGIVGEYGLSDDGQVIAYEDAAWGILSVADGSRKRLVGSPAFSGGFVLSGDGNYLLMATERSRDIELDQPRYGFLLRDTHSWTHWHLPPPATDRNLLSGLKVYFAPGPEITLAWPGRDTDEATPYRRWSAEAGWQPTDDLPAGDGRYFTDKGHVGDEHPFVLLPAAGWVARRTVWVTPAGDTVELLRQNDVPAHMLVSGALPPLRSALPRSTKRLRKLRQDEDVKGLSSNAQARLEALIRERKPATRPAEEPECVPVETQPADPAETQPADPVETQPVAPVETQPVAPAETQTADDDE